MQKHKYIYLFTMLLSLALFTTCRKYPEGGWSNVAVKHLFGNNLDNATKTWKLKLYEVNGIDSTGFITPGNGVTNFENDEVVFKIVKRHSRDYNVSSKSCFFRLDLSKDKNKEMVFIGGSWGYGTTSPQCYNGICERNIFYPFSAGSSYVAWKILKLKNDELIISSEKNGYHYKITLKY